MWTRLGTAFSPCESLVGRQKTQAVTTKGPRQWAAAGRALFSRQADFSPVPVEQRLIFAATQPILRIPGQETNALTPLAPRQILTAAESVHPAAGARAGGPPLRPGSGDGQKTVGGNKNVREVKFM